MIDDHRDVLAAVAAGHLLTLGVRLILPVLLPSIRDELLLGLTMSGGLVTVMWAVYAVGQVPGGILADLLGERAVLGSSLLVTSLASMLLAASSGLAGVVAGVVLLGAGTALYGTTRITVLSDVFEDDTAAQGILSAAGNFGSLVLPLAAGLIAGYGWRYGFIWLLPFYLAALIGLYRWLPRRTASEEPGSLREELAVLLHEVDRGVVVQAVVVFGITMFSYSAVTGMYPSYLSTVKGLSDAQVPWVYSMFFVSATTVMASLGPLQRRLGDRKTVTVLFTISAAALLALPAVSGFVPLLILTFLINAMAVIWPLEASRTVGKLPDEVEGLSFGLIRTVYILIGSTGSLALGWMASRGFFGLGFQLQGVLVLVMLFLLLYEW